MKNIRDIAPSDIESIVKLNDLEVQQTSPMDQDRLRFLIDISSYDKVATVEGQVVAFLIAIRDGAPYKNDNYEWFSSHFSKFLYVDRIVVNSDFSGHRIGSELYKDLFEFARSQEIKTITCEYNLDPPNLASQVFHNKFGFKELGTHWVAGGSKKVSLQAADA